MSARDDILQRQFQFSLESARRGQLIVEAMQAATEFERRATALRTIHEAVERASRMVPINGALPSFSLNALQHSHGSGLRAVSASAPYILAGVPVGAGFDGLVDQLAVLGRQGSLLEKLAVSSVRIPSVHVAAMERAYSDFRALAHAGERQDAVTSGLRLDRAFTDRIEGEFESLRRMARDASAMQSAIAEFAHHDALVHGDSGTAGLGVHRLASSVERLGVSVSRVWAAMATDPAHFAGVSPVMRAAPTMQLYAASRGTDLLIACGTHATVAEGDDHAERAASDAAVEEWSGSSEEMVIRLNGVDARLGALYRGALHALRTQHDDFSRHAATSLRELLDGVLKHATDDADVIAWHHTEKPKGVQLLDGPTKKVTHAARLAFLYRSVSITHARYVNDERSLIQQTFYGLNEGVHKLEPLTPDAIRWLIVRVQAQLHTVLSMAGH